MATLDSAEIRRAAKFVKESSNRFRGTVITGVRRVQAEAEDSLKGQAADALDDRLYKLDEEGRKTAELMDSLYEKLMNFAQALEDTSHELASMMRE